jgi:hypothetical protein
MIVWRRFAPSQEWMRRSRRSTQDRTIDWKWDPGGGNHPAEDEFMWRMFASSWLVLFSLYAQQISQSTLPEPLREPDAGKLIFQAHGVGDQIYTCKAVDGKYAWTLKAPDARLLGSDGKVLGRHFAGPTWEAADGSRVLGKAVATAPSPDSHSVPWLRIDVIQHQGNGRMSQVVSVQRLNTRGGQAPRSGCDNSHAGAESRIPYQADYYFYGNVR